MQTTRMLFSFMVACLCLFVLSGCSGEEGGGSNKSSSNDEPSQSNETPASAQSDKTYQVSLSGEVIDGPIAQAQIHLTDPAGLQEIVLSPIQTDQNGAYAFTFDLPVALLGKPILLQSTGGVDIGADLLYNASDSLPAIPLSSMVQWEASDFTESSKSSSTLIRSSSLLVSPNTTLAALKQKKLSNARWQDSVEAVSSQIGLSLNEIFANPNKNAKTAQVATALGLSLQMIQTLQPSDGNTTVDAEQAWQALANSAESLVTIQTGSNGVNLSTGTLLNALKSESGFQDAHLEPTESFLLAANPTIARLAQQAANRVEANLQNSPNEEKRAAIGLDAGLGGLINASTVFHSLSNQQGLIRGKLDTIAEALNGAIQDRLVEKSHRNEAEFSTLLQSDLSAEANSSKLSYQQAIWLKDSLIVLLENDSSIAGKQASGVVTDHSVEHLQWLALRQSLGKMSRHLDALQVSHGTELKTLIDSVAVVISNTIDQNFSDQMLTKSGDLVTSQPVKYGHLLSIASASVGTQVFNYFHSINKETIDNAGFDLQNATLIANLAASAVASTLIANESENTGSTLLDNVGSAEHLASLDYVSIISENVTLQSSIDLSENSYASALETSATAFQTSLNTLQTSVLEVAGANQTFVDEVASNLQCSSQNSGMLIGSGVEVFGNDQCGQAVNQYTVNTEHSIEWDGTNSPLLGNLQLSAGGNFHINPSNEAVIFGNIALAGGTLLVSKDTIVSGSISLSGNATIEVSPGATLTMTGPSLVLGQQTLTLQGGGTINNHYPIRLDQSNGLLVMKDSGMRLEKLEIAVPSGGAGNLEIHNNAHLESLTLASNAGINLQNGANLTIQALSNTTAATLNLIGNGTSNLKKLTLNQSLTFEGILPGTQAAVLEVLGTSTLSFIGTMDFTGGFSVASNQVLTLDNGESSHSGSITVGESTVDGHVEQSSDDQAIYGPQPSLEGSISYSRVGPFLPGTSLTVIANFNRAMLDSPLPQISISGANTVSATEMTKISATEYHHAFSVDEGNGLANIRFEQGVDRLGNRLEPTPLSGGSFSINNPPTVISLEPSSIAENLPVGTTVGNLVASNQYGADPSTFALVTGEGDTDNGSFTIANGELKTTEIFNFEVKATYSIRLKAIDSDEETFEQSIEVQISDGDEVEPVIESVFSSTENGAYNQGKEIIIGVKFDEPVFVEGIPMLLLETGEQDRNALFSGKNDDDTTLFFTYTIQNGDTSLDLNYSSSTALVLGNASIKDAASNSANLNLPELNTAGSLAGNADLVIDTLSPYVESVNATAAKEYYKAGEALELQINFSEAVVVESPTTFARLALGLSQSPRYAVYAQGSGSRSLTFGIIFNSGDNSEDLAYISNSSLELNGSTLQDVAGNSALLNLPIPGEAQSLSANQDIVVDTVTPSVVGVTPPNSGSYKAGEHLDFLVQFGESVTVGGTPQLSLLVGGNSKQANYLSGSGGAQLIFRYTIVQGDSDTQGITIANDIISNGGTIEDHALNPASFQLQNVVSQVIKVDTTAPTLSQVTVPDSGDYRANQNLDISLEFSESIEVSGTPQIGLTVGTQLRNAEYFSGSGSNTIIFRYSILPGDTDVDGIEISTHLDLGGGSLGDSAGNSVPSSLGQIPTFAARVDTSAPTVASLVVPNSKKYKAGQPLSFVVNFSESVTVSGSPQLSLGIGNLARNAVYHSGSGSSSWTFQYTIQSGDSDNDGVEVSPQLDMNNGHIRDSAGNEVVTLLNNLPLTDGVLVDTTAPTVQNVSVPSAGSYKAGQNVDFNVIFSEAVQVSGTPQLELGVGTATKWADYLSGNGTTVLKFRYPIVVGDSDNDGIEARSLAPNTGTIQDSALNDAVLTLQNVDSTLAVLVDTTSPLISGVNVPNSGTYKAGQNLDYTVIASENVTVSGTPQLELTIGQEKRQANYLSGSGTAQLIFRYAVTTGDMDSDGVELPTNVTEGVIQDSAGNLLNPKLNNVGSSTIWIDSTAPSVSLVSLPNAGSYKAGGELNFVVHFTENVTVTGIPQLSLNVGGSLKRADYISGTTTTTLLFKYTVVVGDTDNDGIVLEGLSPTNGTIQDVATNDTNLTLNGVGDTTGILIDTTSPTVASITVPEGKTYGSGETLEFGVTFSEAVSITGAPKLLLQIGDETRQANYQSGTGSPTLLFRYIVVSEDSDLDGIGIASLALNGGTLQDVASNDVNLILNGVPSTKAILVGNE